jgi:DNA polymerase zeta
MKLIDGIVCSALRDHISISPGGIVFLKSSVKRGILPQMLEEILNTRIMVKQSMKKHAKVCH